MGALTFTNIRSNVQGGLMTLGAAALSLALAACASGVSTTLSGLLAKPEGKGPFPAVVLLHSCGGMRPNVTSHWPRYLNSLGYVTFTVDHFGMRGYGRCPNPLGGKGRVDVHEITKDAYGALAFLAKQPDVDGNRVAVMGFSLGAWAINRRLLSWRSDNPDRTDFKAAIAFYGDCRRIWKYTKDMIPLMQIVGERDDFFVGPCKAVGRQYPEIKVHVIPGAYHAFDSPSASGKTDKAGHRMQYDAAARDKARELTRAFLHKHLGR